VAVRRGAQKNQGLAAINLAKNFQVLFNQRLIRMQAARYRTNFQKLSGMMTRQERENDFDFLSGHSLWLQAFIKRKLLVKNGNLAEHKDTKICKK
jgi:hypothetical protein